MKTWTTITTVRQHGSSLTAVITQGCRLLKIAKGDLVKVTIEKVDESEEETE